MTYCRKELYLLQDFDFDIIQNQTKKYEPQSKFLIVIDVVNNDNGIFCLTTSLRGKNSSLIVPKLTDRCTPMEDTHFFKFDECQICDSFKFDVQTYVQGKPSNVFEESIVTLYQTFNKKLKSENKGSLKNDIFLSLLSCLCQSKFLDRNLKSRIQIIGEQESK